VKPSTAALVLTSLFSASLVVAAQGVPTGKRTPRPQANYVVLTETALATGGGPATLLAGVPVAAKVAGLPRGKVKVVVVGATEVTGTMDGAQLGLVLAADATLIAETGDAIVAVLRPGALVRVLGRAGDKATVETAGPLRLRGRVPAKALVARPIEIVQVREWQVSTTRATDLFAGKELTGKPLARLPELVRLELVEQQGDVAHVRSVDAVVVDGWVPAFNLASRTGPVAPPPPPQMVKPTHEVFVDAPVFADAAGTRRIGTLHGGALVEVNQRASDPRMGDPTADKAGTYKILTPTPVVIEGWVKRDALRQLGVEAVPK
jgi:hypothetical protein